MLHGIMKSEALDSVFGYLEERYQQSGLNSSAAMAQYLRQHLSHPKEGNDRARLRSLLTESSEGSA
jgi:hypothetical protein